MIGIDIEDICRFENKSSAFLNKVYTQTELDYCLSKKNPAPHLAARFCAKEAAIKALYGIGISKVYFKDIEIFHSQNGHPKIRFLTELAKNIEANVSLSHDKTKAIAIVQIVKA